MSFLDPDELLYEDAELKATTWAFVQEYLEGNTVSLKRRLDTLPNFLCQQEVDIRIYKNMKRALPFDVSFEKESSSILHKSVRRAIKLISQLRAMSADPENFGKSVKKRRVKKEKSKSKSSALPSKSYETESDDQNSSLRREVRQIHSKVEELKMEEN